MKSEKFPDMATTRQKPNVVVWEWMNEFGRWRPYDPQVADFIESNSVRTPTQINLGTVDSSLSSYAIDFQTMCQIRYGTGTARPIRRSLYQSDSPPGKGVVWQWEGDIKGQWHTYDMEVACVIEDYFSQNSQSPGSLDLSKTSVGLPYLIDFNLMVQQRIQTGKKRPLRREILPQPYPVHGQSGSATASQKRAFSSTTLSNSCGHNSVSKVPRLNSSSQNGQQFSATQNHTFSATQTQPFSVVSSQPFSALSSVQNSNSNSNTGHLFSSSANLSNTNTFVSAMLPGNSSTFTSVLGSNTQSAFTNVSGGNSHPLTRRQYNAAAAGGNTQQSSPIIPLHPNVMSNLAFPSHHQMSLNFPGNTAPNSSNIYTTNLHGPPGNQGNQIPSFMNHIGNHGNPAQQGFSAGAMGIVNLHGMPSLSTVNGYLPGGSSAPVGSSSSGSIPVPGHLFSKSRGASRISPVVTSATNILMSPAVPLLLSPQSTSGAASSNTKHLDLPQEARIPNNVPKNTKKHQSSGITAEDVFQRYITSVTNPPDEEDCCICCERLSHPSGYGDGKPEDKIVYQLSKCNHIFHKLCVFAMYNSGSKNGSVQCPTCKTIYGEKHGNCPKGVMEYHKMEQSLPGNIDCHTIRILYHISPGIQGSEHPHPGKRFTTRGFPRICFLPDNDDGRKVLKLLIVAWKRRLTFTIGVSSTTGETDTVTWNEIHHKTEFGTNYSGHGYPDPKYIENVLAELSVQGVTESDL